MPVTHHLELHPSTRDPASARLNDDLGTTRTESMRPNGSKCFETSLSKVRLVMVETYSLLHAFTKGSPEDAMSVTGF